MNWPIGVPLFKHFGHLVAGVDIWGDDSIELWCYDCGGIGHGLINDALKPLNDDARAMLAIAKASK